MKAHTWGDVIGLAFILAIIALLVRPSSVAPTFISAFGDGLTSLVSYATAA